MSTDQGAGPRPTREELVPILEHYEAGRFLRALEAAQSIGPVENWRGTAGRILAGRLVRHLGAPTLGTRHILRAWRHDPDSWEARYFFLWTVTDFRGALATWRWLDRFGAPPGTDPRLAADFMILRGRTAALLRDFWTADRWFAEAEQTGSEARWLRVERIRRLSLEDRNQEAVEMAERGLAEFPGNWALVHEAARGLQLVGRDDDSLNLLRRESAVSESAYLCQALYALEIELNLHREALVSLDRMKDLCPMAETSFHEWTAGARATCHHRLGNLEESARWAAKAGGAPWWEAFRRRLEDTTTQHRRKVLALGFERQSNKTCVPATLTTLGRFWNRPADQLEVAEAICYDGTSSHAERRWAESHGWVAREFRVTLPAARALIDREIPFALTTVAPANAHEQAVMGYDDLRASLLIRDPYFRNRIEVLVEGFLEAQKSSGPRGMVMVPAEDAHRLDGIELPDAELHDRHHELLDALDRHDRPGAVRALAALRDRDPEHRLVFQSERAIAGYDRDIPSILAALERLLESFPDDVNFQLGRLGCLRDLARREDRLAALQQASRAKGADALLWQEMAAELVLDAREHAAAIRWLNRAERVRHQDASATFIRAEVEWGRGRFATALELYRFAACLDDKREQFAYAYFRACRHLKRTEEAMDFLRRRFRTSGTRSSLPGRTLVWACNELDRTGEALTVLEESLAKRPSDGDLKLFAAEQLFNHRQHLRSETLLAEARGLTDERSWRRSAAALAERKGAASEALKHWRTILDEEPMALDAYRASTHLLGQLEGRSAALALLRQACERFPHFVPLHQLHAEWAHDEAPAEWVAVARRLVDKNPADAWSRRDLALALSLSGEHAEALHHAETAATIDPGTFSYGVLASIHADAGDGVRAREAGREALRRSADNLQAMRRLLEVCTTLDQRKEEIAFIQGELSRQTTFGEGLLRFPEIARPFLSAEELLGTMDAAHRERPDLWQAWSGLAAQLCAAGQLDRALEIATGATDRFPLVPRVWMDLATTHRARHERDAEIAAMEKVRELNCGWTWAMRELAAAYEARGQLARSRDILEAARLKAPRDAVNLGTLGWIVWKQGDRAAGFDLVREAAMIEPGYEWAWARLAEWGPRVGRPEAGRELAEELTRQRPAEARSWLVLAKMLEAPDLRDEALQALDRALRLNPRMTEGWDVRAILLARAGRWDEAMSSCRPAVFGDAVPSELGGRAAWILAQRGDVASAIDAMREVLRSDPSLVWGWRNLSDWLIAKERHEEALETVEMLCRLSPGDAVALGYSADLKLHVKRRAEAKSDLRRAFELEPNYLWAGDVLFDLLLEDREFGEALDVLHRLRQLFRGPSVCERELRLMLALGNRSEVLKVVATLCAEPEDEPVAVERFADQLIQAGLASVASRTVLDAFVAGGGNPETGTLWVRLRLATGRHDNWKELERLDRKEEAVKRAFLTQIEGTADELRAVRKTQALLGETFWNRRFQRILAKHGGWFRSDTRLWGKVGYVLRTTGSASRVVAWLSDWRDHADAEPWMLVNLIDSLHQLGNDAEAREAVRRASTLARRDSWSTRLELLDGIHSAVEGDETHGRSLATALKNVELPEYETNLRRFLEVVTTTHLGSWELDPVHKRTLATFAKGHARDRSMCRAFSVLTRRLAERHGSRKLAFWCRWQVWKSLPLRVV